MVCVVTVTFLLLVGALGLVSGHQQAKYTLDQDVEAAVRRRTGVRVPEMYLPSLVQPHSECGEALAAMVQSLNDSKSIWAAAMVDSWGKSRDGVLFYGRMFYGVFDECMAVRSGGDKSFSGKYCHITPLPLIFGGNGSLQIPGVAPRAPEYPDLGIHPWKDFSLTPMIHSMGPPPPLLDLALDSQQHSQQSSNTQFQKPEEQNVPFKIERGKGFFTYTTCMPSVCTKEQLQESLNTKLKKVNLTAAVWDCQDETQKPEFSGSDIGFIATVSSLLVVLLVASVVDIYIQKSGNTAPSKGPLKFLLPFSASKNLQKIFHINTNPSPSMINTLHGIRVLSMTWVIWCHQQTDMTGMNEEAMEERFSNMLSQVILNGYSNVDTFFFLSGLLLAYSTLRQIKNTGRFNIIIFYLHRIIRLVPPIALVCWMNASVVHLFLSGPFRVFGQLWVNACQKDWWTDLVFINNYQEDHLDCLGQTWYVSVDSQLYLIAPLLLLPLHWFKKAGRALLYVATLVSIIVPAAIIYDENLPPEALQANGNKWQYYIDVYLMPWCRAGPWVVGIWLGYIFHELGNRKVKMSPLLVATGWTVASVTGFLVVFGMWSYNTLDPMPYDIMTAVVYGGLHRSAWAASVAWVVFACHNGYGGMVDGFLSHPSWQPLSRLTYTIYLVAVNMQYTLMYNSRVSGYYTPLSKIIESVGALFVTLPIAILVSLIAEAPIMGLEKLLLFPESRKPEKLNVSPEVPVVGESVPGIPLVTKTTPSGDHEAASTTAADNKAFIPVHVHVHQKVPFKDL